MKALVFDYSRLRGRMREKGQTLETLSKATGIGVSTLSLKMSRGTKFDCEQAWMIARCLDIEDMNPYFFEARLSNLKSRK